MAETLPGIGPYDGPRIAHATIQAIASRHLDCIEQIEDVQELDPKMFHVTEYRIKPEPRRFWVNVYPREHEPGLQRTVPNHAYLSRAEADEAATSDRIECIEVVEVMKP